MTEDNLPDDHCDDPDCDCRDEGAPAPEPYLGQSAEPSLASLADLSELGSGPRLLVVGDAFRDRYWIGKPTGLSAEAPIPKIAIEQVLYMAGGAANVAKNCHMLGCQTTLLTSTNHPTKNRLMVGTTQVARWDEMDFCLPISCDTVLEILGSMLSDSSLAFDGIIISDYGKGTVTPELVTLLASLNRPLFIDTKQSPMTFPDTMNGAIFFPNDLEFKTFEEEYRYCRYVLHKQGAKGMTWRLNNRPWGESLTFPGPVVSVNGAGDTVIAAVAHQILTYRPALDDATAMTGVLRYANAAAAVSVSKPMTSYATQKEITEVLNGK